ncbi:hypothetical protein [Streptomyces youssoufiensis]
MDADDVERHACPRCGAQPGSPCRSRGGAFASAYHTRHFTLVPRLKKALRSARRRSTRTCRARTSASATRAARPSGRNSTPSSTRSASTASRGTRSTARNQRPGAGPPPLRGGAEDDSGSQGARPALRTSLTARFASGDEETGRS